MVILKGMSVPNKLAEAEYEDVDIPNDKTVHYTPSPHVLGVVKHAKKTIHYDYASSDPVNVRKFV